MLNDTNVAFRLNRMGVRACRWVSQRLAPWIMILSLIGLPACDGAAPSATAAPATQPPASELIFYNWADYMPQSVLDDFTAETGIPVTYLTYDSMEEAAIQVAAGLPCDVAVLEYDVIPPLVAANALAEIDFRNVPNFRNISGDFRDLTFDPGNKHTVPFGYGTTGIVVRHDLVDAPITRWADLWDPRYAGKVAARPLFTELIGVAVKSLGRPLNTEDPQDLEAALQRLRDLQPILVDDETGNAIPTLLSGEAVLMVGWGKDALESRRQNRAIDYVLPAEGTLLWGDAFVIPARSPNQRAAERFVDFLLRPDIGARIINANQYATANAAAYPLVDPAILHDAIIFPPAEVFDKANWYQPLSAAGKQRYADLWKRFMADRPR